MRAVGVCEEARESLALCEALVPWIYSGRSKLRDAVNKISSVRSISGKENNLIELRDTPLK